MKRALLIGFALLGLGSGANAQCLEYELPTTLVGTIIRKTFPGRPNYQSIKNGDEPETIWVIRLLKTICVNTKDYDQAESGQREIQLVLNGEQYKTYKNLVGRKVSVNGSLYHAHTGHHHKKILITVSSIKSYRRK